MPQVKFSKNSEKEFAKLPKVQKKKVIKKIKILQNYPLLGKLLSGELKGLRSIKAWPYRIIYEIDKFKNINILRIQHRQKVYK